MSQENIDVVRGAIDDWNRRDWRAWLVKHAPDMVAIPHREWPEPQPSESCEAWFQFVQQALEPWDEQRLDIDDVHSNGPLVVVLFRWVARGRHTQLDVDLAMTANYTVANGQIQRIEFFFDATEALEAAGIHGVAVPPKHVGGPLAMAEDLRVFEAETTGSGDAAT